MESVLSPREIQTRIRSGESVADIARVAGMDHDRVERFAAPVIAEREHVAGLAMTSSARRRGETSSHRTLRGVLNERLLHRGIDADSVRWDSFRLEDGRWSVTADYDADGTSHQALFYFDLPGRYSVAGNDEGRWILGDARAGSSSGSLVEGDDEGAEPTIDLSDELALVRVVQDIPVAPPTEPEPERAEATVTRLEITEVEVASVEVTEVEFEVGEAADQGDAGDRGDAADQGDVGDDRGNVGDDQSAENTELGADVTEVEAVLDLLEDGESGLETLYQMFEDQDPLDLGTGPAPSAPRPSDAAAVPEVSPSLSAAAWEPAIVVDYPVEPSEDTEADAPDSPDGIEVAEGSDDPGRPEEAVASEDRRDEAEALEKQTEPVDQPLPLDIPDLPPPTPPKPARRKRASVPSWDEIVFGGPKDK